MIELDIYECIDEASHFLKYWDGWGGAMGDVPHRTQEEVENDNRRLS